MGNLSNALQQLRAERREAQSHVEKLDKAISLLVSLNGSGTSAKVNQPTGIISAQPESYPPLRAVEWRRRNGRDGRRLGRNRSQH